jgi:putative membrane protein
MIKFLLNGAAVLIAAYILPGVHVSHYGYALLTALALSLANTFIKPILIFLTIPLTLITLGIFLLVINAIIIMMVSKFVPGFWVDGFWWALLFSLIMSVFNSMISEILQKNK